MTGGQVETRQRRKRDGAILDLKLQRDKVKQYQKKIQAVLEREHEIAKQQLAAGNKGRALTTLRQRKYQESLLAKTDGQLENLEKLVSTIEFSMIEVSVLHGLQQGNEVLKQIHKEMNIESVEKLLEETQEAREYQREIDEMLANNLTSEDEEAVQLELQALQTEATGAKEADRRIQLPSAPTGEPVAAPEEGQEEASPRERERVPVAA